MSRLVAASTRTSTLRVCELPTGSNSPSCSTRSSFDCKPSGNSPTSSRKIVPPCARAKRPSRFLVAPVNAPCSWPKNSLSIKVAGIAENHHRGARLGDFFDLGDNFEQRPAAADDFIGPDNGAQLRAQIFGLDGQRADFLLGFQALVHVAQDQRIKRLALHVEARQRHLRLKAAALTRRRRE